MTSSLKTGLQPGFVQSCPSSTLPVCPRGDPNKEQQTNWTWKGHHDLHESPRKRKRCNCRRVDSQPSPPMAFSLEHCDVRKLYIERVCVCVCRCCCVALHPLCFLATGTLDFFFPEQVRRWPLSRFHVLESGISGFKNRDFVLPAYFCAYLCEWWACLLFIRPYAGCFRAPKPETH